MMGLQRRAPSADPKSCDACWMVTPSCSMAKKRFPR